jgi:hypothetical protein
VARPQHRLALHQLPLSLRQPRSPPRRQNPTPEKKVVAG